MVVLSVAFLGGVSGPGSRQGPEGACALLTQDEIGLALGVRPGPGEVSRVRVGVSICRWPSVTGEVDLLYAIVAPRTARDRQELARSVQASIGEPSTFIDVEGLGDFAVWVALDREPAALQVFVCDVLLQIGSGAGEPWDVIAAKALASRAVDRVCHHGSPQAFERERE